MPALDSSPIESVWRPGRPVPVGTILGPLRRGSGDPTYAGFDGAVWRALQTPCGAATLALAARPAAGEVHAQAWGSGAEWALAQVPDLLGGRDDPTGFTPTHAFLARTARLHPHWRIPRTGLVFEALVAATLEQKVTGREAWTGWRRLVRRYGSAAPGPAGARGMHVLPPPQVVRAVPSWEWLAMQVDPTRSATIVRAAARVTALQRTLELGDAAADRALRSLPGVGAWTSAEVRQRAHGHSDAVSLGDYHLPASIGIALTGAPVDDGELADLLERYRPHRYRVQRLVELSGVHKPRHGPRMAPRRHLPGSRLPA